MRTYKRWHRPQVISFDLDDTLYDNGPNMLHAETKLQTWLSEQHESFAQMTIADWAGQRRQVASQHPHLGDDMTALRQQALRQAFESKGFGAVETKRLAADGFELFLHHRNEFQVAQETVKLLKKLQQKYRLVAITNGNAKPHVIGLENIFEQVLYPQAGQFRAKPYADLFRLAESKFAIKPQQGLHLGDHPVADVAGAIGASWQAGWFNPQKTELKPAQRALALPHFEYQSLADLVDALDF